MNSCWKCRGTGTVVFFNQADVPCHECGGSGFFTGGNETAPSIGAELDALRKENTKLRNSLEYAEKVYRANCQSYRDEIASLKLTQPPSVRLLGYQDRVAAALPALFHDDPTDIAERVARFFEEAVETCQALGLDFADAHKLVNYTYDRPVGEPAKEIGAALVTLASLCVVAGFDLLECGEADLEKLQRPETIARIRAKRATRHGRGPLPGFAATASEGVEVAVPAEENSGYRG